MKRMTIIMNTEKTTNSFDLDLKEASTIWQALSLYVVQLQEQNSSTQNTEFKQDEIKACLSLINKIKIF